MKQQSAGWRVWLAVCSVALGAAVAAPARAEAGFTLLSETLGPARAVQATSHHVYAGVHHQLQVYAVDDGKALTLVHQANPLEAPIEALRLDSGHLYVAAGRAGLIIYDVARPAHPKRSAMLRHPNVRPVGISVSGSNLYAASQGQGLQFIDASDAANPRVLATLKEEGVSYRRVLWQPPRLYIADAGEGFSVYDASDPQKPLRLGTLAIGGQVEQIAVQGRYAYLAAGTMGLRVVDLDDPAHPMLVGKSVRDRYEVAVGVALSGTLALVADHAYFGYDWHRRQGGLRVIDVSQPQKPVQLADMHGGLEGVDAAGSSVFTAAYDNWDYTSAIQLVDVSTPSAPRRRDSAHLTLPGSVLHTQGSDVLISNEFLSRFHFAQPIRPRLAWDVEVGEVSVYGHPMVLGADVALVREDTRTMRVVDLSDPDHPRLAGRFALAGFPLTATGRLLVAKPWSGPAQIYDASDPDAPVLVAIAPASDDAALATVDGRYLYTVSSDISKGGQLKVYDIADPTLPTLVNEIHVLRNFALVVADGLLYLGLDNESDLDRLQIYSLADAPALALLSDTALPGNFVRQISVCGRTAFATMPSRPHGGVAAIDVSDPTAPYEAARYYPDALFTIGTACLPGDIVVVSTDTLDSDPGGVHTLRYTPPSAP